MPTAPRQCGSALQEYPSLGSDRLLVTTPRPLSWLARGGGGSKKILVPACSFFFGVYPQRGRRVRKKNRAKIFPDPKT